MTDLAYWHRRAQLPGIFTLLRPGNDCLVAILPLRELSEAEKIAADRGLRNALKRLGAAAVTVGQIDG